MYTREELLERLEHTTEVLRDSYVKKAFTRIDRADFVPKDYRVEAYEDYPLPIGYEQTISQPTTVAFMLEKLSAQPGDKVLDVGSGSGWTTALLADIVGSTGSVVAVERVPELVVFGKQNIEKYHYANVTIHHAGNTLGVSEEAPFQRILVSAAAHNEIPKELTAQLAVGGIMIAPVDDAIIEIKKHPDGTLRQRIHSGFAFVPLIS